VYGNAGRDPFDEQCPLAPIRPLRGEQGRDGGGRHRGFRGAPDDRGHAAVNSRAPARTRSSSLPKVAGALSRARRAIELGNIDVETRFLDVPDGANSYGSVLESDRDRLWGAQHCFGPRIRRSADSSTAARTSRPRSIEISAVRIRSWHGNDIAEARRRKPRASRRDRRARRDPVRDHAARHARSGRTQAGG